jgi:hypothetical protein
MAEQNYEYYVLYESQIRTNSVHEYQILLNYVLRMRILENPFDRDHDSNDSYEVINLCPNTVIFFQLLIKASFFDIIPTEDPS